MAQSGQFLRADFFDNVGGLNTSDSPFKVADNQATGGKNYEYALTGGIRKCKGASLINATPDTQLKTLGIGQHFSYAGVRTHVRAAGTRLQAFDLATGSITNLTEDTAAAGSAFLDSSSTQPVVMSQFNTSAFNMLWCAGGGMDLPRAVYSTSKVTKNGTPAPTGAVTTSVATGTSTFLINGSLWYSVVLRKASTLVTSNATLDVQATLVNKTDAVTLTLALTGLDTTKYDQIWIYRSVIGTNGVTGFTTGDLIARLPSTATSYTDTGTSIVSSTAVPRVNNAFLENSVLPAGTYNSMTVWKRRMVVAQGSTLYCSDVNKPESWSPNIQTLTVPSGGPITALGVLSFSTPVSQSIDELLVVFKEREVWVVTGSDFANTGALKFIDFVGCTTQSLVVTAVGYLAWVDYRGVYFWDGSGKPTYVSRALEDKFQGSEAVVDRSKLGMGVGIFARERNEIFWILSSTLDGEQVYRIRCDLRLTVPQLSGGTMGNRMADAVFITDVLARPYYALASVIPDSKGAEQLLAGDASGFTYKLLNAFDDAGVGIDFQYESKFFDLGAPGQAKRIHKIIVWCQSSSDAQLQLDYWTNYSLGTSESSSLKQPISNQVTDAYWDLAYWDAASWDLTFPGFNPVVFNLSSTANNSNEGDCIKLRFKQSDANAPVTIAGFTILYTMAGMRH